MSTTTDPTAPPTLVVGVGLRGRSRHRRAAALAGRRRGAPPRPGRHRRSARPPGSTTCRCRAPRVDAAGLAGRDLLRRPRGPGRARLRQVLPRHRASAPRPARPSARRRRLPEGRARRRRPPRLVRRRRRRRHPLRRRLLGGRRRRGRRRRRRIAGAVSIDLSRLDRVARDRPRPRGPPASRPACSGRRSRTSCARTGYTLRHFPQSFEFSTLGGWLATRSGGHYATVYTHIDDLVESMRVVTPAGTSESLPPPGLRRRPVARPAVPGQRGHARHHHRGVDAAAGPPSVQGFGRGSLRRLPRRGGGGPGAVAVGAVPHELPAARRRRGGHGRRCRRRAAALLVLGFESADHPVEPWIDASRGAVPPTTGARCPTARRAPRGDGAGPRALGRASGDGRSSGRPTRAMRWWACRWCSRPSRRRSRGTASRRCTPR